MPNDGRDVVFNSLSNKAAIEYIKNKVPAASKHWDDWIAPVHAKSFTVAGAPSVEFATDMHDAVTKAISNGTSIADFRKDFDKIVEKYGWSYKGNRGWRTRIIYNTNMRTARMAAKWQTIQDNKDIAPYLEYVAVDDNRTRPQHRAWDGIVRPVDDSFWDTHYPPNGWNCRCTVVAMSEATMKRKGKVVSDQPNINREDRVVTQGKSKGKVIQNIPHGIDAGWDHNVGQSWIAPDVALGKTLAAMPPLIAGSAYQNMVTKTFMDAVSKSYSKYFDDVKQLSAEQKLTKTNLNLEPQFTGFLNPKVQMALIKNDVEVNNLALVTPQYQTKHITGAGRSKENSAAFVGDMWRDLPNLVHNYQVMMLDADGSLIIVPNQLSDNGRRMKIVVKLNYSDKRSGGIPINQVTSVSLVPEINLKAKNFKVIDGSWQ